VSHRAAEQLLTTFLVSGDASGDPFEMSYYLEDIYNKFMATHSSLQTYQRHRSAPVSPFLFLVLIDLHV
jgi:hypothetical protein